MRDTLLSYALLTAPSTLQAGTAATLTLVVSNPSSRRVRAQAIVVGLPVGTTAKALVADPTGIQVTVPRGWSSSRNGGEIRLTPRSEEAREIGPGGLAFVLAGVQVNEQPGTTGVAIDETAAWVDGAAMEQSTGLPLAKFPGQFQVSELRADRLAVDAGGTVELQWAGTAATYHIQYSPGDGPPVHEEVGPTGPYTSRLLHRTPNVVFTLVVSVAVPGQDHPLVLQRQLAVDVRAVTIHRFDALPAFIPPNGVAQLTWRTSNAVSVVIQPGDRKVEPNGSLYLYLPAAPADPFTLIAVDADGTAVSQQRTIRTDPSLRVNAERLDYSGKPGAAGKPWGIVPGPFVDAQEGGKGDPGASVTVRVGPLDLAGTSGRVRGAFSRGGDGGDGGKGFLAYRGARGGDGGPGGDLVLQLAAQAGPPAQLVVDVSGGQGGQGGGTGPSGYGHLHASRGGPGRPGRPGHVTLVDAPLLRNAAVHRVAPAPSDTLLGYGLLEEPGDDGTAVLTLSLSGPLAEVETVTVPLPLLSRPDGWTAVTDGGGVTTLTPPATLSAGGATFTFIPLTERPPSLAVRETAGGRTRTALFTLS